MDVYTGHHEVTDIANIRNTTALVELARCMLIVCNRFPHKVRCSSTSYMRHCAKTGGLIEAYAVIQKQTDGRDRARLNLILFVKLIVYRVPLGYTSKRHNN